MSPHSSSPAHTLTEVLAQTLARHAQHTFGLMGNGNAHLIDALGNQGVPFTAVRHEAATIAAADAYTRTSGHLAIATTTYGAGFTNAMTALAEASQARTPMLVVVGSQPTSGKRPWDVEQDMFAAAVGVRYVEVSTQNIRTTVDNAVAWTLRVRKPVVIAVPYDLVTAPLPVDEQAATPVNLVDPAVIASLSASVAGDEERPATQQTTRLTTTRPHSADIERACDALAQAKRPVVLTGRGAWISGAQDEVRDLCNRIGAVTAATALGRGQYSDASLHLGITGGFGQEEAMEVFASADTVVVVGASLNQFTMRFGELFGEDTTVIRLDLDTVDAPTTTHHIDHLLLQGDARDTLRLINSELATRGVGAEQSATFREEVRAGISSGVLRNLPAGVDGGVLADGRLDPRAVAARIAHLLPEGTHITQDGGHFIGWANMYWPVASPERMIMVGTAYQTIGLGFGTVPGVVAAAPGSTIALSTGDGGGLMALADLETAVRTAQSLIIVCWNDGAYGAEVHLYGRMGLDEGPMRIPDAPFHRLAEAFGARGVLVESLADLDALQEWVRAGARGTILLDCRISSTVTAPYQREIQRANGLDV